MAIPAFTRYVKKSRTAEAVGHLNKEWAGSLSYYETDHMGAGGMPCGQAVPWTIGGLGLRLRMRLHDGSALPGQLAGVGD